jgi:serine/threonine protein phosphatase PrpC
MEFTQESTQIKQKVIQLCSAQDDAYTGSAMDPRTGETYHYGIITDGHGNDEIVADIRGIITANTETILNAENPHLEIQSRLDEINRARIESIDQDNAFYRNTKRNMEHSFCSGGATFLFAKLYATRIETFSIGDSELYVMINSDIVYHNPKHNWDNENERLRVESRTDIKFKLKYQSIPHIISPERTGFTRVASLDYFDMNGKSMANLAPTQSIGHNSITQFAPEKMTIPFEPTTDSVKIILASDGLWDVFAQDHPEDRARMNDLDGEQLADLAQSRWKQEWEVAMNIEKPDELYHEKSQYPASGYDDVSVITIMRNPF